MNNNKLILNIEIEKRIEPVDAPKVNVTGNFNTEHPLFSELAQHLAYEYNIYKTDSRTNLVLLEKLEILCKKARELTEDHYDGYDDYYEVKVIQWKDKVFLENKKPVKMYDEIICLGTDLYLVRIEDKFGLVTSTEELLRVEYTWVDKLNENCLYSKHENGVTIYNMKGELLMNDLEDTMEHFNPFGDHKDYIWAKRAGKWGLFDPFMNPLIPFRLEYDRCQILYARNRDDLYIKVFKGDKCGLINGVLNIVIVPLNDQIADIYHNVTKEYVIVRKAGEDEFNFTHDEVLKIEDKVRKQN